jgi:23S rRNA (adenine2503-C2)-methyltransferase
LIDLYAMDEPELAAWLAERGHPAFRARQIRRWLYEARTASIEAMTDLPLSLRQQLAAEARLGSLVQVVEQQSADGTQKRLYRLPDLVRDGDQARYIESVLMPYEDGRRTACISTQAGCAMGCVFCATGQMGFIRHLTSAEIFEQAMRFAVELHARGERLSNIVLMGMGEPFHNYDASLVAIRRLQADLGIGARHITVSTVGLVPQIRRFAEEGMQVRLAISLHAADDEARGRLLPINKRWPLSELMEACRFYAERTGRRVTFEWALIAGRNDDEATARKLGALLQGLPAHVNLIPLNPTPGFEGGPTRLPEADRFVAVLAEYGIEATVRVRRGIDIDAGCGQLRSRVVEQASP